MSKKDALVQLQSRLADKKQGDAQGADAAQWLAVEIAGQGFMFPLRQSGEIFSWTEPHGLPYAKDWFLGVANLRGSLYGVVSVAKFLQLSTAVSTRERMGGQERRLIGFHPAFELNTVLLVDRLAGLKNKEQLTALEQPGSFQDDTGHTWRVLDLQQLAHDPEFVTIAHSL
jgi:twitching motility protein PilI